MLRIDKLFGKSPFAPLQTHMSKVAVCIKKLTEIFQVLKEKKTDRIAKLVDELCKLEHEADLTKNDIRNHLPKSFFLPIDRSHLLDILSIQDSIADKTEDIGILLTLKSLDSFDSLEMDVLSFLNKNVEVFLAAHEIISELDTLLESSFGGIEAEKVKVMVESTAHKEYEVDLMNKLLMKKLLSEGDKLPQTSFYLWIKLIEEIRLISSLSERLANRIRMVLELK
ncbi:MAG: TIGR00153 family protein [Rhabdochlamydiaceae bacterium]|jgi:predicted phosphate transport protein (TIGR00153 family)